jgi:hypothetical protein
VTTMIPINVSPRSCARILAFLAFATPLMSLAASLTGTVTNKTTGKPASGDDVVLINLQQGMQEAGRTKTDSHGNFSFDVPDGPHLLRVDHQKASYFRSSPPGTQSVAIDIYDVAEKVEGVRIEASVARVEADNQGLHVTHNYFVKNDSMPARTQFSDHAFEVYLPADAQVEGSAAQSPGGMAVNSAPVPMSDPGHFAFIFAVRPGETRFQVTYRIPYSGSYTFKPRLSLPADNVAVLLPKSMKFTPSSAALYQSVPDDPSIQTFLLRNASPKQALEFSVSGTGSMPREAQGQPQGDQGGGAAGGAMGAGGGQSAAGSDTRPGGGLGVPVGGDETWVSKYKWWLMAGVTLLLVVGAAVLVRSRQAPVTNAAGGPPVPRPLSPVRPAVAPAHAGLPAATTGAVSTPAVAHASQVVPNGGSASNATMLAHLKEEFFALETERLEGKLSEADYAQLKSALEVVLRRTLSKQG